MKPLILHRRETRQPRPELHEFREAMAKLLVESYSKDIKQPKRDDTQNETEKRVE